MTRVLIVSDDEKVKDCIKSILDLKRDIYPILCSLNYRDIIEKSKILPPHYIIIDMRINFEKSCEIVRSVKKDKSEVMVIAMVVSNDLNRMLKAFRNGVNGYLKQSSIFNELFRCISFLRFDDLYISVDISHDLLKYIIGISQKELERSSVFLSSKESEFVKHLTDELNTKEIAHLMQISKKTVNNYKHKIMKKLNIYTMVGLTKYAIRENLTEL